MCFERNPEECPVLMVTVLTVANEASTKKSVFKYIFGGTKLQVTVTKNVIFFLLL